MTHEEVFQACVKEILAHEGGLSRDKNDPGGVTQWGISIRYLKSIGLDINGDGVINEDDIIGLPIHGAIEIYRRYWWDAYRYGAFNELIVVEKVFDLAVNMGAFGAHKLLQLALNKFTDVPLVVDGILGKKTFIAANTFDGNAVRNELRTRAKERYVHILNNHPNLEVFRKGWMNRAAW